MNWWKHPSGVRVHVLDYITAWDEHDGWCPLNEIQAYHYVCEHAQVALACEDLVNLGLVERLRAAEGVYYRPARAQQQTLF